MWYRKAGLRRALTGTLYFDADGSGAGFAAHAIASLTGGPLLTHADFLLIA